MSSLPAIVCGASVARAAGFLRPAGGALAERADLEPARYLERLAEAKMRLGLVDAALSLSYGLLRDEFGGRGVRELAVLNKDVTACQNKVRASR